MKTTLRTTLAPLEELDASWRELSAACGEYYFRTLAWYRKAVELLSAEGEELLVLTADDGERLMGVLPLRAKHITRCCRRLRLLETLGAPYSPTRGGLARPGYEAEVGTAFGRYALRELSERWDIFSSWDVSEDDRLMSNFLAELKREKPHCESFGHASNMVLKLDQFATPADYLNGLSASVRRDIKRGQRRMSEGGDFCLVRLANDEARVRRGLEVCAELRRASWKEPERAEDSLRQHMLSLAAEDKLRFFFLCYRDMEDEALPRFGGRGEFLPDFPPGYLPIAVNLAFCHNDRAFFVRTHYREHYAKFSPGIVLAWFSFAYFLSAERISIIDFMRGGEDYKCKYGACCESTLHYHRVVNPWLRLTNCLLHGADHARQMVHAVRSAWRTPDGVAVAGAKAREAVADPVALTATGAK